jgi:hypothetical protein
VPLRPIQPLPPIEQIVSATNQGQLPAPVHYLLPYKVFEKIPPIAVQPIQVLHPIQTLAQNRQIVPLGRDRVTVPCLKRIRHLSENSTKELTLPHSQYPHDACLHVAACLIWNIFS